MVYEKLQSALSEEEQPVYKQRCDELAPSLRYCAYNIGDQTAMDDLVSLRSQAHGDLLDNLDVSSSLPRHSSNQKHIIIQKNLDYFSNLDFIFTLLKSIPGMSGEDGRCWVLVLMMTNATK